MNLHPITRTKDITKNSNSLVTCCEKDIHFQKRLQEKENKNKQIKASNKVEFFVSNDWSQSRFSTTGAKTIV